MSMNNIISASRNELLNKEPVETPDQLCSLFAILYPSWTVSVGDNFFKDGEDLKYGSFLKSIECGRSYLYGDSVSLQEMLKKRIAMPAWQKAVYRFCMQNPNRQVEITINNKDRARYRYKIYKRGEYVEVRLPYHDAGGEMAWISNMENISTW